MENDVLAIDPTAPPADSPGVELREGLRPLDHRIGRGFPVGTLLRSEFAFPHLQRGEPHEVELGMPGGCQADDLLALVGHVEELIPLDPEHAEGQVGNPVVEEPLRSDWLRRRRRQLYFEWRRLVVVGLRLRRRLDGLHEAIPVPSLGDSVGEVPAVRLARGGRDDPDLVGDWRDQLGDGLSGIESGFVAVRPDDDVAAGQRRPVGESNGFPSTRPGDNEPRADRPGGVGGFLALDDQHAGRGICREQVEPVEWAGFGE